MRQHDDNIKQTLYLRGSRPSTVRMIVFHPTDPRIIYACSAFGLYKSYDGGENWVALTTNMPTAPVNYLLVHPRDNDLIAATHGRAFWILDDIGPLEALAAPAVAAGDRVLAGRPRRLYNFHHFSGWFWPGHYVAPNPPYGAGMAYWLAEPAANVSIQIRDEAGAVLRTLSGPGEHGVNRVYWDLRRESAERPDPR